jgi:hypothetical protein
MRQLIYLHFMPFMLCKVTITEYTGPETFFAPDRMLANTALQNHVKSKWHGSLAGCDCSWRKNAGALLSHFRIRRSSPPGEASRHTMVPTYVQYTCDGCFHLGNARLPSVRLLEPWKTQCNTGTWESLRVPGTSQDSSHRCLRGP